MKNEVRVMKRCPVCNQRLFDKVSTCSGGVEIKCPRCGKIVRINLEYRHTAPCELPPSRLPSRSRLM